MLVILSDSCTSQIDNGPKPYTIADAEGMADDVDNKIC